MNILFDLTAIQPSAAAKFHGGGYYGEVVFFALLKKTKDITGLYNSKFYINPKIMESGINIYDINKISPQEIIEKENINTFYTPLHNSDNEWQFKNIRYIITWHGVRELEIPCDYIMLFYANNFKKKIKYLLRLAMKRHYVKIFKQNYAKKTEFEFLTVSEHSRTSIRNFFPQFEKKYIPVFYPPYMDENEKDNIAASYQYIETKKYFLLTSSARWEKNNLRAVWAFDELFSQRENLDLKVVLTGVTDEKIFTRTLRNRAKFILMGYIDRPELLFLHKNAYAFIYPSLNEGFGYPPMESMRYGVPVAASGTSSIPEICQNAAIYFDPYNVSEIKNRIIQLLDTNIYNEYSARAVERYKIVSERQKRDLENIVNFITGGIQS